MIATLISTIACKQALLLGFCMSDHDFKQALEIRVEREPRYKPLVHC